MPRRANGSNHIEEIIARMTTRQLFNAACDDALRLLHDLPVEKVLNRIDVDTETEMPTALARHFAVIFRDAVVEGVDVRNPVEVTAAKIERMNRMRDGHSRRALSHPEGASQRPSSRIAS